MAEGYLQKYMSKRKKSTGSTLANKISNAKTRLADVGETKDTRNWFEKLTNLPEDQNILMDIIELVNRPQQAAFAAIKAKQEGNDIGASALEGLTGKADNISGGELLRNAGMKDSEGVGADDVLGFALDIFADPLSIAAPVKVANTAGKGYKMVSGYDAVFNIAKKGIKKTAKVADSAIEAVLKLSDAKAGIKYTDEFAKEASKLGKVTDKVGDLSRGKLESYKAAKDEIKMAFDYKNAIPGKLVDKVSKESNKVEFAKQQSLLLLDAEKKSIKQFAKKTGKTFDEVAENMAVMREAGMKYETSVGRIIRNQGIDSIDDINELNKITTKLDDLGVKYKVEDNGVTITDAKNINDELLADADSTIVKTKDTRDEITLAKQAELASDPEFMKFYSEHADNYNAVAKIFKETTGFNIRDVSQRTGYMRHKNIEKDAGYGAMNDIAKPSTQKFASRAYVGTAADINRRIGKKLFSESEFDSFADFIQRTAEQAEGAKIYNEILLGETFKNPELVQLVEKGADDVVPVGMTKVDTDRIVQQIKSWGHLIDKKGAKDFLKEIDGKTIYMDKRIHSLMFKQLKQGEGSQFLKFVGRTNNMFKKLKTFSPGFHMRNVVGNHTNMWLSGANMLEIETKYYPEAMRILNSADDIIKKRAFGAKLTLKEEETYKIVQEFAEEGLFKAGSKIQDLEEIMAATAKKKGISKSIYDKAFELNAAGNTAVDGWNRMALMLYAKKNPKYLLRQDAQTAGEAVRKVLFDPADMSPFEKEWAKKFVPFYTFTKQNLFFQIDNLFKNPKKYVRLSRAVNKVWDGQFDENEYMDWQKQAFNLPLPINDSNGNPLMLKLNLPLSDLGEYMSNPLKRGLASVTPIMRAPTEAVLGKEIFTGADIDLSTTQGKVDFIAKNTGLDLFTKTGKKIPAAIAMEDPNTVDWVNTLMPSIASAVDTEKNIISNQYQEYEELAAYIKQLKDAGVAVRTVNEIKETAEQRLARLKRNRKKNSSY